MRVFVTGGAGFIGSCVCELLLHQGAEVVAFDNFSTGYTRIDGAEIVEGDVRNFDEVLSAMSGCTHIAHLAAMASVPASVADPALSEAINLQGTLNVIEAAHQVGVKRIACRLVNGASWLRQERTHAPGAVTSGLMRPSSVGPRLLLSERVLGAPPPRL